jgi:LysM domain
MLLKFWITALLLLPSLVFGQVAVREDRPQEYIVQPGDTLWDISALFLQDPWVWPQIWYVNPQIENPHLIYPGDVLRLRYVDGQPQLQLTRGTSAVRLSPEMRTMPTRQAIDSIPLDAIREFFSRTRVIDEATAEAAPYVVAGQQSRILVGAGDDLFARGDFSASTQVFQIYRVGDDYKDPVTRDVIGIRADYMGSARSPQVKGDIAKLNVYESASEINVGDILLPLQQDQLDPLIFPAVPDFAVDGQIIAVDGGVSNIGQLDVVALNLGRDAGLMPGHVLAVMQRGERVRDRVAGGSVQLPDEQSGTLIIFRSLERMSFGLILEAQRPLAVGDRIALPE